jgi:hypothetical protein
MFDLKAKSHKQTEAPALLTQQARNAVQLAVPAIIAD